MPVVSVSSTTAKPAPRPVTAGPLARDVEPPQHPVVRVLRESGGQRFGVGLGHCDFSPSVARNQRDTSAISSGETLCPIG